MIPLVYVLKRSTLAEMYMYLRLITCYDSGVWWCLCFWRRWWHSFPIITFTRWGVIPGSRVDYHMKPGSLFIVLGTVSVRHAVIHREVSGGVPRRADHRFRKDGELLLALTSWQIIPLLIRGARLGARVRRDHVRFRRVFQPLLLDALGQGRAVPWKALRTEWAGILREVSSVLWTQDMWFWRQRWRCGVSPIENLRRHVSMWRRILLLGKGTGKVIGAVPLRTAGLGEIRRDWVPVYRMWSFYLSLFLTRNVSKSLPSAGGNMDLL